MSSDLDKEKSTHEQPTTQTPTLNDSFETKNSSIYESAKTLQNDLNNVNSKLNTFFEELNNAKQSANQKQPNASQNSIWTSNGSFSMITKSYTKGAQGLPDRIFIRRNSLLTELFKIEHVRTIRNIFISIMTVLALQVLVNEFLENGKIDLHVQLFTWCFGQISIVFYTWLAMSISTSVVVYYAFHFWSINRLYYLAKNPKFHLNFKNKNGSDFKLVDKTYDLLWLSLYVSYLFVFITVPAYITIQNSLPPASSFIVLLEQLRMLMKTHAFVRSNIPRALKNGTKRLTDLNKKILENSENDTKTKTTKASIIDSIVNYDSVHYNDEEFDESKSNTGDSLSLCPSFTNYLYFLFAPTLVYADNYPRTPRIRWNYVFNNFAQVIGAIFYIYLIFVRFCIPVFQHFNTEHVTVKMFIQSILNCTLPGTLLLLVGFFAFLHCWLNAFSEMLRFGDRMFYKDWWNSTNFSNYYRTWNVVVHDWLYTYIYKDSYLLLGQKHKTACQFIIFFLSALFHEYALTLAFGFFYPVLFVMFGAVGFACMFLKFERNTMFWNFITWIGLFIGLGGLMCLYSIEWYARQNCSQSFDSSVIDYLLPRSFTCGMKNNVLNPSSTLSQVKMEL